MAKKFCVSSFTRVPEGGEVYQLRARDCRARKGYVAATVVLAQFAKFRQAQDVANLLNAALATTRRKS